MKVPNPVILPPQQDIKSLIKQYVKSYEELLQNMKVPNPVILPPQQDIKSLIKQ
ncbi:unnamed protein product, partial [Cylicostephanus goldi]